MGRTISVWQQWRLIAVGATVTATMVTATDAQLWRAGVLGKKRVLLNLRGQLTVN